VALSHHRGEEENNGHSQIDVVGIELILTGFSAGGRTASFRRAPRSPVYGGSGPARHAREIELRRWRPRPQKDGGPPSGWSRQGQEAGGLISLEGDESRRPPDGGTLMVYGRRRRWRPTYKLVVKDLRLTDPLRT